MPAGRKSALQLAKEEAAAAVAARAAERVYSKKGGGGGAAASESPKSPSPSPSKKRKSSTPPRARAAKEEAAEAMQARLQERVTRSAAPAPKVKKQRKSTSPPKARGRSATATRRHSMAGTVARPKRHQGEEEEEDEDAMEEEEEEYVDPRVKVVEEPRNGGRRKRSEPVDGQAARKPSYAKKARQPRQEEEEEEEEEEKPESYSPPPPPVVNRPRRGSRSPYVDDDEDDEEGQGQAKGEEEEEDEYVDPRFYSKPASARRATVGGGGASAGLPGSPNRRMSWGAPVSYLQSFWRGPAAPDSPSKRVAFREQLEEYPPDEAMPPPPPPAGARNRRRSTSTATLPAPSSPMPTRTVQPSPPRSIMKKKPAPSSPSHRMSFTSLAHLPRPTPSSSSSSSWWQTLRQNFRRLQVSFLVVTLLASWVLGLGVLGKVTYTLWTRTECPRGQVREGFFGLVGDCVVSRGTVKKLVYEVQRRTAEDVCRDPWTATAQGQLFAPPRYSINDVWGGMGLIDFPWADLEAHGIEREWRGASLHQDITVHLRGRGEVLGALWRRGAVACRAKVFLAETWHLLVLGCVLLLLLVWAVVSGRARVHQRRQVEKVKRIIVDLLIAEGEMPPDHARDDLLHGLPREYQSLGLTRAGLKKLWPSVIKAVEKDTRVTKAPIEKHGRAIPHWVWLGKKMSHRARGGAGATAAQAGGGGRGGLSNISEVPEEGGAVRARVI